MPSWTCLLLSAIALLPETGPPPPPAMPGTILAAPINATWAANQALQWHRRGFSGFVFEGIADSLPATPSATVPFSDPLLEREIRAAVSRLKDAGIKQNFLHCFLTPEDTWFASGESLERAVQFFGAAGAFCKKTGLRGMALDTKPDSMIFDLRWDGYALDPIAQERVRAGAQSFGRRILRAFIRECPEADIFIPVDDLSQVGRLWFDLMQGFAEAPGAADSVRLHLVLRGVAQQDGPNALRRAHDTFRGIFADRLSGDAAAWWRDTGHVSMALEPLGYTGDVPVATVEPGDFRVLHAAAQLLSDQFVWINAPEGGWWSVDPDDPLRSAPLKQQGAARVANVRPLTALWADYNVNSPLSGQRRVGPWPDGAGAIDVLAGPRGAAAIFWAGLEAPLDVPNRFNSVVLTQITTGNRTEYFPRDGKITLPATAGPLLLAGLPQADWTVPAGLWAEPLPDPRQAGRALVRYGWRNLTGEPLNGELRLDPVPRLGAGGAFPVVDTQGDADLQRSTHLLGRLSPADPLDFRVNLVLEGGTVRGRAVHAPILPPERWRYQADGPLTVGAPVALAPAPGTGDGYLYASTAGDVGRLAGDGTPQWLRRFRETWRAGPTPVLLAPEQQGVLLSDDRGGLRCLDTQGALLWETKVAPAASPESLYAGDLFRAPYDGILLLGEDATLYCLTAAGRLLWHFPLTGTPYLGLYDPARAGQAIPPFAESTGVAQRIYVATADGADSRLCRLDAMGHVVWQHALPAPAASAPLVYPRNEDADFAVAVGLSDGTVIVWQANDGRQLALWNVHENLPVGSLLVASLGLGPALSLLACSPAGLTALGAGGERQWEIPIAGALSCTAGIRSGKPRFYVHDAAGHLTLAQPDGSVTWQCDLRAAGPPQLHTDPRTGVTTALIQTTTGLIRALEIESLRTTPVHTAPQPEADAAPTP